MLMFLRLFLTYSSVQSVVTPSLCVALNQLNQIKFLTFYLTSTNIAAFYNLFI